MLVSAVTSAIPSANAVAPMTLSAGSLGYPAGNPMALTQTRPVIGSTTNLDSTSVRNSFETGTQLNTAFAFPQSDLKQSHIGDRQSLAAETSFLNGRCSLPGNPVWLERQPEYNMGVDQNHPNSPHSSGERTGETTSPVMRPRLRKNPKMSSPEVLSGTSIATGLPCLVMTTASRLALDLVHHSETVGLEYACGHGFHL